jgi:cytochrome c
MGDKLSRQNKETEYTMDSGRPGPEERSMRVVYAFVPMVLAVAAVGVTGAPAQQAAAGAQAFVTCKACHTVNKGGRNGIGPNLSGLFSRPAASAPGYNYSPALKKAGLRWDDATLNQFLAGPSKKVPGTKMPIGMADPAKRAAIIAYLKAETAK